jgi:hypothetical protein
VVDLEQFEVAVLVEVDPPVRVALDPLAPALGVVLLEHLLREVPPLLLGEADTQPGLQRVRFREWKHPLGGIRARVELGAVRTPVAVRVAAAGVGAERHLLAVGQAVAVNVVVAGDRVFAVEQAVVVEIRVAGSRVTRIAVAVAVGVRVSGIGVPSALARVADPVAVAVVALRITQRGGPRERRRGP